jgi:5-methylcytosine-specific restriction endonuclease McrA
MKNKRYKNSNKTQNSTPEKILSNWKRYYISHREYHQGRNREYYLKRMVEWYEWFEFIKRGECEICGFNQHPKAIDFHHINPADKNFEIGKFINGRQCNEENKELVLLEIDKCKVLCANCHRIEHFLISNEHTDIA